MPVLSFICPTHYRPHLLGYALASVRAQLHVPAGWRCELVVVAMDDDTAAHQQAQRHSADIVVTTTAGNVGAKRAAGFAACTGDLVAVVDDDDLKSPVYAAALIRAHERGHAIIAVRDFRYVALLAGPAHPAGACARWRACTPRMPAVGYHRAYARTLLEQQAWADIPRQVETELDGRLRRAVREWQPEHDIAHDEVGGIVVADTMVNLQHGANLWNGRPFPPSGTRVGWNAWMVDGEGDVFSDAPAMWPAHLHALRQVMDGLGAGGLRPTTPNALPSAHR